MAGQSLHQTLRQRELAEPCDERRPRRMHAQRAAVRVILRKLGASPIIDPRRADRPHREHRVARFVRHGLSVRDEKPDQPWMKGYPVAGFALVANPFRIGPQAGMLAIEREVPPLQPAVGIVLARGLNLRVSQARPEQGCPHQRSVPACPLVAFLPPQRRPHDCLGLPLRERMLVPLGPALWHRQPLQRIALTNPRIQEELPKRSERRHGVPTRARFPRHAAVIVALAAGEERRRGLVRHVPHRLPSRRPRAGVHFVKVRLDRPDALVLAGEHVPPPGRSLVNGRCRWRGDGYSASLHGCRIRPVGAITTSHHGTNLGTGSMDSLPNPARQVNSCAPDSRVAVAFVCVVFLRANMARTLPPITPPTHQTQWWLHSAP